jgi:DNA uptake protein ComE-like DNA-binding protein
MLCSKPNLTADRTSNPIKLWQIAVAALSLNLVLLGGCSKPPATSTTGTATEKTSETATNAKPAGTATKIDVNSAPIAELDKLELPGTKPSLSERIQGKRPYKTADDLVSKKAISADEYKLIKNLVVVGKGK